MRTNRAVIAFAIAAVGIASSGCDALSKVLGGTEIHDESVNVNVNVNPPASPAPSPSPTATPLPGGQKIAAIFVSMYGEDCPPDVEPSNQSRTISRGCRANLTCTAILDDGRDLVDAYPTAVPQEFKASSGENVVVKTESAGNAWNRSVLGIATGTADFYCKYGDADSRISDGPWRLTVAP